MSAAKRRVRGKLTRKEMKEDKLVTFTTKAIDWLREYYRPILIGVGALVVVGVSVWVFFALRATNYRRASEQLSEALVYYQVSDDVAGAEDATARETRYTNTINALQKVVDGYPGSPGMKQALFYLGESYFQLGNYDEAKKAYDQLSSRFPKDILAPLSLNNLAYAYEGLGDRSEAIATYNRLLQNYPDHFLSKRVYLNIGRLWEQENNYEEAEKNYQRVIAQYPDTQIALQAQGRIEWLATTAKVKIDAPEPEGQE